MWCGLKEEKIKMTGNIVTIIVGIIMTIIGVSVAEDAKSSYYGFGKYINKEQAVIGEGIAVIGIVITIIGILLLIRTLLKQSKKRKKMNMRKCTNCGNLLPYGMKFCDRCGKQIEEIIQNYNHETKEIDKIKVLKEMYDNGYISNEEFEIKKKEILSKI